MKEFGKIYWRPWKLIVHVCTGSYNGIDYSVATKGEVSASILSYCDIA